MDARGTCSPAFDAVRVAFENNWVEHDEVGACVAATVDGEMVVDLWGGTATFDGPDGNVEGAVVRDWDEDTIINVWSTTKTMAALCCLMLGDRGVLELHAPVAAVWPEFAEGGKEAVTTAHVLSHAAGLSGWDAPLTMIDLLDHDRLVGLHAAQSPWWEPGSASGYHAISQGYLLGEIVKRVTGRSLGTFFAEEVAGPIGADFHIGTGPEHDARVAHVIPPTDPLAAADDLDPASVAVRTLTNPELRAEYSSSHEWRRAEIPAAGGHGNARAVAQIHTPTACGGSAGGVTLLTPEMIDTIFEPLIENVDLVLGTDVKLGMGYGLPSPMVPLPNERTAFWGGWGGSLAIIDTERRMSFSYVMNRMGEGTTGDLRGMNLLVAMYLSLG